MVKSLPSSAGVRGQSPVGELISHMPQGSLGSAAMQPECCRAQALPPEKSVHLMKEAAFHSNGPAGCS